MIGTILFWVYITLIVVILGIDISRDKDFAKYRKELEED